MKINLLVNIIMIFPLIFSCSPSKEENAIVQKVNSFYQENKGKSFKIFKNWNIGVREGEKDLYLFDFIENREKVKYRFIIKKNTDSLYIKRIHPHQDSLFHLLNKRDLLLNDYLFSDLYFKDLTLRFFSLKASKIMDIEDGLFLIEKKDFLIIYSESKIENLKYKDYIKFNEQVWYCITK